jgi:hypothetical protein
MLSDSYVIDDAWIVAPLWVAKSKYFVCKVKPPVFFAIFDAALQTERMINEFREGL